MKFSFHRGLILAALAFVLTVATNESETAAQATEFKNSTADIGAWNLKGMANPISDDRAKNIATTIFWMDPDLLFLVEINPISKMDMIVQELSDMGVEYQHETLDQPPSIDIGVLFKEGVVVSDVKLLEGSDAGNPSLRKALAADVQVGQFDFVAVAVHLKSGRTPAARDTRTEQAGVIAEFVAQETAGSEKDVLIVGDYNMIPLDSTDDDHDLENFEAMNPDGALRFISADELRNLGTHLSPSGAIGNHLDGFAVSANDTDEYIDGTLHLFGIGFAFREPLSWVVQNVADHFPMVGTFVVTEDDD